ncbi:hypothetical protein ABEY41_02035 [Peribacillus butanolivorans]
MIIYWLNYLPEKQVAASEEVERHVATSEEVEVKKKSWWNKIFSK